MEEQTKVALALFGEPGGRNTVSASVPDAHPASRR
jgi:hypothetical protein